MTEVRNRFEVWSDGSDEGLQGIGGDAFGNMDATGIRIPFLPTAQVSGDPLRNRYMFLLAGFTLAENENARIVGWRQLLTIGVQRPFLDAPNPQMTFEREVNFDRFRFPDGNASYHLHELSPEVLDSYRGIDPNPFPNIPSFGFRMLQTPGLLYEAAVLRPGGFYVDLLDYTAPNNGRPPGRALAHLGTMHGVRTPWYTHGAWTSLDLLVRGPTTVAMFGSVRQTAGVDLSGFKTLPNGGGLPPEYQMVIDFSPPIALQGQTVQYRAIGAALDVKFWNTCDREPT
jgi:hypothetical protein